MRNVAGMILAQENDFGELTMERAAAALPIAARYRLIDFVLSGMVNSGMIHVGVVTCYKYSSLMEHLGSGGEWDLQRKSDGLFILPPFINRRDYDCFSGDIDMLIGAMPHLKKCRHRYVMVSKSNLICNINFEKAFKQHCKTGADITLIYNDETDGCNDIDGCTFLQMDGQRISGMEYKPVAPESKNVSMDIFIIERQLLIKIIEEFASKGKHNFIKDILLTNEKNLKIYGWEFKGHVGRVNSIEAYFKNNLNFLNKDIKCELLGREDVIYSETSNMAPTRYGENVSVKNSLVADGCFIEGMVEDCVLSGGVNVGRRAFIKNSVIMENTSIEEGCVIKNTIIDKGCIISRGTELTGCETHPVIIRKGTVL